MVSIEDHSQHSLKRYSKSFSELHIWMDEPSEILYADHTLLRHDLLTTPSLAKKIFGKLADQAYIDHILMDLGEIKLNKDETNIVSELAFEKSKYVVF